MSTPINDILWDKVKIEAWSMAGAEMDAKTSNKVWDKVWFGTGAVIRDKVGDKIQAKFRSKVYEHIS